MLKSKKPGLAIVELIIVLAISAAMFGVVIALLGNRQKAQSSDAAKQVLSIIAKVRNEAQTGLGPTTEEGKNLLKCNDKRLSYKTCGNGKENEIFGEAIKFYTDNQGNVSNIQVYKLMQNTRIASRLISAYEVETIPMPGGLVVFALGQTADNTGIDCASSFYTCYKANTPDATFNYISLDPLGVTPTSESIGLAFRNRTGESFAFAMIDGISSYTGTPGGTGYGNYKVTPDMDLESTFTTNRQGFLRLALGQSGPGTNFQTKMNSSIAKYYINFDLSIPNNQTLEVVQ